MIINSKERNVIIENLRSNPLYQYKGDIDLGPVNYIIANNYNYEDIKSYIKNAKNVHVNFEYFLKELEEGLIDLDNGNFKILDYFSLDSRKKQLIQIGKKNKFRIELSSLPLDKENINILETPFYAIVTLGKNEEEDENKNEISFNVQNLEFIEAINFDVKEYKALRTKYTTKEWFDLIITTLGYNPNRFTIFEKFNFIMRLIPYCTKQFHYMELGNKETGKSFFYSEISERFSKLLTGDSLSIAKLIYDNNKNEDGLIKTKNILGIDEIVDTNFKNKEILEAFQTYLQDGKVSRDSPAVRGKASIVLVGNIKNVEPNLINSKSLFDQFNSDIKNETFFDKFYYFSPSWKTSKINIDEDNCDDSDKRLSLDFFINSITKLREEDQYYNSIVANYINFEGTDSGRDSRIKKTVAGLLKILHPDGNVTQEEVETYTYIALCGRKLLLDQLNIKNSVEYTNDLYARSKTNNLEINAHNYYNLSILLSEKLFSEQNLSLSDVEYYYYDYGYFDRTKFSSSIEEVNGQKSNVPISINAHDLNKKLEFDIVEPRLAIKFKGDQYIYKLALSTYGINANIIEYDESKKNGNENVDFLNDLFTLIKCQSYEKPNEVYKLKYYSNTLWDKIREENKDNSKILNLINIFENTNKGVTQIFDENIELKERIRVLEKEAEETKKSLNEINSLLEKITTVFNHHEHNLKYNRFTNAFEGIGNISTEQLPLYHLRFIYKNNVITPQQSYYNTSNTTIFDYEELIKLRKKYVKDNKTSQN